jgi:hypothetical protein
MTTAFPMNNTLSFFNKNYAYPYYHDTNKMHYAIAAKLTLILLVTTFLPAQLHPKSLHTMPFTTASTTY